MSDLGDYKERLERAERSLEVLWREAEGYHKARLEGKMQGVSLALSYLEEM